MVGFKAKINEKSSAEAEGSNELKSISPKTAAVLEFPNAHRRIRVVEVMVRISPC